MVAGRGGSVNVGWVDPGGSRGNPSLGRKPMGLARHNPSYRFLEASILRWMNHEK
jgi:hypothetical protein